VRAARVRAVRWTALASALLVAACRTLPAPSRPAAPAPAAETAAPQHYRIDAAASQVLILVYRDGPMARLGHNHVLSVHDLSGDVTVPGDLAHASFSLQFPVESIAIDEPALRAQQGEDFQATLDAASIAGTRAHMLGEQQLDAAQFPTIRLDCEQLRADGERWVASVRIRVRDHDSTAEVPVTLQARAEALTVSGDFDLTHAQLGLTPYSVALGALRVAQTIHIHYRLLAQRAAGSGAGLQHP